MKEIISISIQLTKEDIKRANVIFSKDNQPPTVKLLGGILGGVTGILALMALITHNEIIATIVLTSLALYVYAIILSRVDAIFKINKIWTGYKAWHSPIQVKLFEDGLEMESVRGKNNLKWDDISKILESEDYFIICYPNLTYFPIPKRASKGRQDDIKSFFRERIGDRLNYPNA